LRYIILIFYYFSILSLSFDTFIINLIWIFKKSSVCICIGKWIIQLSFFNFFVVIVFVILIKIWFIIVIFIQYILIIYMIKILIKFNRLYFFIILVFFDWTIFYQVVNWCFNSIYAIDLMSKTSFTYTFVFLFILNLLIFIISFTSLSF